MLGLRWFIPISTKQFRHRYLVWSQLVIFLPIETKRRGPRAGVQTIFASIIIAAMLLRLVKIVSLFGIHRDVGVGVVDGNSSLVLNLLLLPPLPSLLPPPSSSFPHFVGNCSTP